MKNLYFYVITVLIITVGQSFAQNPAAFKAEIKNKAIPIDTTKFYKSDGSHNRKLFDKLSNIKVLGIGEQSHGTHEFFQTKKALISTLIREQGYNLIGLEAPFAEVENLNNYVLEGKGDLKEILKDFRQYTFECSEFESLVESIRNYDKKVVSKVKFFGFDFQSPFGALNYLYRFNQAERSINGEKIQSLIKSYIMLNNELYSHSIDSSTFSELKAKSREVINDLLLNGSNDKTILLSQYIENYNQFLELNNIILKNDSISMNKISVLRDSLMAQNVLNKLDKSKILLWAHNAHLQKTPNAYSKSMGSFLKEKLKKDYAVIGQTTSSGYFTAFDPIANKMSNKNLIIKPGIDDFEYYLSSTGIPVFFVESAKIKSKLPESARYRMLGYGVTDRQFVKGNLLEDYDFIIHIDQTTGNNSFYLK